MGGRGSKASRGGAAGAAGDQLEQPAQPAKPSGPITFQEHQAASSALNAGISPASLSNDGSVITRNTRGGAGQSTRMIDRIRERARNETDARLAPLGLKVNWTSDRGGRLTRL